MYCMVLHFAIGLYFDDNSFLRTDIREFVKIFAFRLLFYLLKIKKKLSKNSHKNTKIIFIFMSHHNAFSNQTQKVFLKMH